jgi:hypothetical protein
MRRGERHYTRAARQSRPYHADVPTVAEVARRLAELLSGQAERLWDPSGNDLEFLPAIELRPLEPLPSPPDCWAVDGGQALVADARCLQVAVTRAARVRWQGGLCTAEEEGPLNIHVLAGPAGGLDGRRSLAELGAPVRPESPVDLNLLRDWSEWQLVRRCVEEAEPGAIVLVDGDLQPDWRVSAHWVEELLGLAAKREARLVGVTKHSSLARGGAPLVGQLELEAEQRFGPRARWWAAVGVRRPDLLRDEAPQGGRAREDEQRESEWTSAPAAGLLVTVARLDPDARFAFRIDLPGGDDPETTLGQLCSLSDDAAFPGYPYPLSLVDRLASCPAWLREELWSELDSALAAAGVRAEVVERSFADRHSLMERA